MTLLRVPLVFLLTLIISLGAVAVACDDGGNGVTLEEFFQRLEELDDEFETRSAELEAEFEELNEQDLLDQAPDLLRRQVDLIGEFVNDLDALEAPEEAAEVHQEAVDAGREVEQVFGEVVDGLGDATSLEELFGQLESSETADAAFERFDQACLDAEQVAADNDIEVDLNCGDA